MLKVKSAAILVGTEALLLLAGAAHTGQSGPLSTYR